MNLFTQFCYSFNRGGRSVRTVTLVSRGILRAAANSSFREHMVASFTMIAGGALGASFVGEFSLRGSLCVLHITSFCTVVFS